MSHVLETFEQKRAAAKAILDADTRLKGWAYLQSPQKKALERPLASVLGLAATPAILALATAIGISDHQNPFFKPNLKNWATGEAFTVWKLRTMNPSAEGELEQLLKDTGLTLAELKRNGCDPRITKLGKHIRKFSLDELPQFWNVALGHLDLVGPRTITKAEWEQEIEPFSLHEPYSSYREFLGRGIRMGLTGLTGILGRSDLKTSERVELDVLYLQQANWKADARIILKTIPAILSKQGAY